MRFLKTMVVAAVGLGVLGAGAMRVMAQEAPKAPETKKEMPPGHPPIAPSTMPAGHPNVGGMPAGHPKVGDSKLPSGHPQVGGQGGMPAGHPQVGGQGGQGGLPAGHPMVQPAGPKIEVGKAAAGTGATITIVAVQTTANAPAIGAGDAVKVVFFNPVSGRPVGDYDTKLSEGGQVKLENVTIPSQFVPVVGVTHGGAEYVQQGEPVTAQAKEQTLKVPVYETTQQAPKWEIQARHVMVTPVKGGIEVMEMLTLGNPGDRTWVGTKGADGKSPTWALPIPPGAIDVESSDGPEAATVAAGKLVSLQPLTPGFRNVQVKYAIPADKANTVTVALAAPAPTQRVMVIMPRDATTLASEQLKALTPGGAGKANLRQDIRYWDATGLKEGESVSFKIGNVPALTAEAPKPE